MTMNQHNFNRSKSMKLKKGYIREDGMVFVCYTSWGGEWWLSQEKFLKKHKKDKQSSINWRIKNQKKAYGLISEWKKNNTKRISDREKIRKQNDPLLKLKSNLRSMISTHCRRGGYKKRDKSYEILGCSFDFFKGYIEKLFKPNMSWENRTEWHLDHIIPISYASTYEEIVKYNHYTNFQPLWAKENQLKGAQLPFNTKK